MSLRYFQTYRGTRLPLTLTGELTADSLRHRNTYIRAEFDAAGRLVWLEKLVYGEVELRHDYRYADDGTLCSATIQLPDDEPRLLRFDPKPQAD